MTAPEDPIGSATPDAATPETATPETATTDTATILARLGALNERIVGAGGSLENTKILAVTKTFPASVAESAIAAGLTDLGENYAQEFAEKAPAVAERTRDDTPVRWHFIGGLQRNKVKRIAHLVDVWQTVDRASVASEIAKRAPGATVFVQVNTTSEPQKSGIAPSEAPSLVAQCQDLGLNVTGLMTIGPTDQSDPRPGFSLLKKLTVQLSLQEASMGMTADLEYAVAEGSTLLRVGTGLFGARPAKGVSPRTPPLSHDMVRDLDRGPCNASGDPDTNRNET